MQNMKRIISFWISILICTCIFARENENLNNNNKKTSVSKIKVFLDDVELLPEDNASNNTLLKDENENTSKIKLSTIMSFTNFCVGKEISVDFMEKEIIQTQLRLMNSGLFYTASVSKMESRKNPGTYVIYITVSTGFLMRFGGGGIYGIFGETGIGGHRQQLLYFAGWNKNGVSYLYEHIGNTPLIAGGDLFTNIPSGFTNKNSPEISGKATFGSFITPDFRFCVDVNGNFNFDSMIFTPDFSFSPYLAFKHFMSDNFWWAWELRINYFPLLDWDKSFEGSINFDFSPIKQFTIAALFSGGYCNHGYAKGTLELQWNALNFSIPPCFPCHIVPYTFTDIAYNEKNEKNAFRDSYGAGIYLIFDCPVFATFNFSYGINHEGKGKFCFAATQSF